MLAKNPDERFQTPSEAAAALARWSGEGGGDLSLLDVLLEEEAEAEATERPEATEPPRKPKTKRSRPRRSSLTRRPSAAARPSSRRRRPEMLLVPLGLMAILGIVLAWTFGPWKRDSGPERIANSKQTSETTAPESIVEMPDSVSAEPGLADSSAQTSTKDALARLSATPTEHLPRVVGRSDAESSQFELLEVQMIWDLAQHNGFTDLARFQDRWFCVFREEKGRGRERDGDIRVLESDDGVNWISARLVTSDLGDLIAPKITPMPDGQLMLTATAFRRDGSSYKQSLAWFSGNGRDWTEPIEIAEPGMLLWRPTWHNNQI